MGFVEQDALRRGVESDPDKREVGSSSLPRPIREKQKPRLRLRPWAGSYVSIDLLPKKRRCNLWLDYNVCIYAEDVFSGDSLI